MSYFIRSMSYVCLALLLLVVRSPKAFAQVTATANLNGIVKDTSDAVVSGAKVTITSTQTGATRTAISDAIGSFSFVLLPPGTYRLQIVESGFKTATVNGINLYVGQTITQNVVLSPGAVQQTVEVNSAVVLLEPTSTDVGTVVTPTTVESLPLNGRDFGELATVMAPGAESVPPYDPTKERYATFAVNGSSGRNVMAEQGDQPARGRLGQVDQLQKRGFARSRQAGEEGKRTAFQHKSDVAQHFGPRAIAHADIFKANHGQAYPAGRLAVIFIGPYFRCKGLISPYDSYLSRLCYPLPGRCGEISARRKAGALRQMRQ